jgi:carbon monoxide dehydrogenase subunit G
MEMTGEYRIAAAKEEVWKALNDPEVLKASIAGAETVDKVSDTEFAATVLTKVGPVKAKFKGKVTLSDLDPPNGYTISGEGQGGAAGFAKGGAQVSLSEDGDVTVLTYTANANVGGKLAQIGSRLIDATARKMADDFFAAFAETVAPAVAAPAVEEAAAPPEAAPPAPEAPRGLSPWIWVGGLIAVVVVILLIYGLNG